MRKFLAPVLAACLTAILVGSFAIAQPGVGFSRSADFSGTGSSGSTFELSTAVTAPGTLAVAGNTTLGDSTSADQTTVNGLVIQTSTAAASSGAKFTKTTVGSTTSRIPAVHGVNNGSYDTTASELHAAAVFGECNASISAGANALHCSGVYGYDNSASNATDRYAVRGEVASTSTGGTNIFAGGFVNLSGVNATKFGISASATGDNGTKFGGHFGASGTGTNWALYTTLGDVALNVSGGDTYAYASLAVTDEIKTGGTTGPQWSSGTGTPEGAVTAVVGSIFSRTNGSTDTTLYRKETGAGNTGWVAVAAGGGGSESTVAGAGLTLTGSTVDAVGSSDFDIGADLIDMSTAVTMPGSLAIATTTAATGLITATAGGTSPANWTTTGAGDLVSADDLTVADDATITDAFTANGHSTLGDAAGDVLDYNGQLAKFGNVDGSIYMAEDQLNSGYDVNATDYFIINYNGYNGGATQFRDVSIYNGKQAAIATFNGDDKAVDLAGALNVAGLTTVAGLAGTVQTGACGSDTTTALAATTTVLVCTSGGLYGMGATVAGRIVHVVSKLTMDLAHEHGPSTASNRIVFPGGYTVWYMYANQTETFIYDGALSRWVSTSEFRFPAMYVDSTLDVLTTSNLVGLTTGTAGFTSPANYTTTGGGDFVSADKVTAVGNLEIAANSQLGNETGDRTDIYGKYYSHGVEPALSGAGCSACTISEASTDSRGVITCTDGPNVCVVTFSAAFDTNPPACSLTSTLTTVIYFTSAPTTTVLNFTTQSAGAQTIHYRCDGIIGTD